MSDIMLAEKPVHSAEIVEHFGEDVLAEVEWVAATDRAGAYRKIDRNTTTFDPTEDVDVSGREFDGRYLYGIELGRDDAAFYVAQALSNLDRLDELTSADQS